MGWDRMIEDGMKCCVMIWCEIEWNGIRWIGLGWGGMGELELKVSIAAKCSLRLILCHPDLFYYCIILDHFLLLLHLVLSEETNSL